MTATPIPEIINEIDAYLSSLRQARELLLDRKTQVPQRGTPRRETKVLVAQAKPDTSSRQRADEKKSRSNDPIASLKAVSKRVDTGARVPSAVAYSASHLEQPTTAEPKRTIEQQGVVITRLPARRRISAIRSARHRTAKSDQTQGRMRSNRPSRSQAL